MPNTPFSDPNYGLDTEIAEVVSVCEMDDKYPRKCYRVWNNVTGAWARNIRSYTDVMAARSAARRLIETYNGLAFVV